MCQKKKGAGLTEASGFAKGSSGCDSSQRL
jgi:hypothetical protein